MRQAFRLIYNCDRKGLFLKLFYTLCTSLLPLLSLYVLKYLVDGVTAAAGLATQTTDSIIPLPANLAICVLAFCGITLLNRLISALSAVNNDVLTQKLIDYINNLIQNQSVRLDMAYYDNPDYHDTFHRAQQEAAFRPIRILENFVSTFGAIISLAGVTVMLLSTSWKIVAVMLLAVTPAFLVKLYKSRRIYRFRRESTQEMRRSAYYGQLLSNRIYAKEVRSFGLAPFLRHCYVDIRRRLVSKLLAISRRLALYDALTAIVETIALVVILVMMVKPVTSGAVTIGTFVMLFEAFRRGQSYLNSLVSGISGLYEHRLFISNLFEFLQLQPDIVSPQHPVDFPSMVSSIVFDHITFRYPGMNIDVLSNYTLSARMGEITHLKGENGFGKTTLLKLLLRLYDPQQGTIFINGIDIRQFDLKQLRHNISAIFQDHVQFYFTARQNITFGDINHPEDESRLVQAIRLSGADGVIDHLSNGLDTMLGRQFQDGEELSMGQWQRLALARQLYSPAPILVFDEPTAWMDVQTRNNFTESLETLKQNHIIILVSHQ